MTEPNDWPVEGLMRARADLETWAQEKGIVMGDEMLVIDVRMVHGNSDVFGLRPKAAIAIHHGDDGWTNPFEPVKQDPDLPPSFTMARHYPGVVVNTSHGPLMLSETEPGQDGAAYSPISGNLTPGERQVLALRLRIIADMIERTP